MADPHINDEEFKRHWPKLRAEFVLEESDIEAKRLAGAAWKAAKRQAGQFRIEPQSYKIVTTEIDGHMIRYAMLDRDGPVLVTSWTVVLDDGQAYMGGGHHPIPLEEAEILWSKTIDEAKSPEPEPEPEPQNLEEAVRLLLEAVDYELCDDEYSHDDLRDAAEHVRRFLDKKS